MFSTKKHNMFFNQHFIEIAFIYFLFMVLIRKLIISIFKFTKSEKIITPGFKMILKKFTATLK